MMVGRYTPAHQFKRARRQLKFLRTRLGWIIRDIRRKIDGDAALEARFGPLLDLAQRVRTQDQHQRGPKVYALHRRNGVAFALCRFSACIIRSAPSSPARADRQPTTGGSPVGRGTTREGLLRKIYDRRQQRMVRGCRHSWRFDSGSFDP